MKIVHKDENERDTTREAGPIGAVLYTKRISRYVEGKCVGRIRGRRTGI